MYPSFEHAHASFAMNEHAHASFVDLTHLHSLKVTQDTFMTIRSMQLHNHAQKKKFTFPLENIINDDLLNRTTTNLSKANE